MVAMRRLQTICCVVLRLACNGCRWGERLVSMAIDAVKRVRTVVDGRVEVDVKRYARVEKIPGGELEDCMVRLRE